MAPLQDHYKGQHVPEWLHLIRAAAVDFALGASDNT